MYIPRFCGSSAHSVISYAIKQTSQNGDRLQSETGEIAISDMLEFSRNVILLANLLLLVDETAFAMLK